MLAGGFPNLLLFLKLAQTYRACLVEIAEFAAILNQLLIFKYRHYFIYLLQMAFLLSSQSSSLSNFLTYKENRNYDDRC